jgi:hypothetical protein
MLRKLLVAASVMMVACLVWAWDVPFEEGVLPPVQNVGDKACLKQKDAVVKRVKETVVVSPATFYYAEVPATYEWREEKVLVREATKAVTKTSSRSVSVVVPQLRREAYKELRVVPATFETVEETVVVTPEREEDVFVPATFKKVVEKIKVAEAHKQIVNVEDKKNCYTVTESAERFVQVEKLIVDKPASVEKRICPAVTKRVSVTRVKVPAHVEEVLVPAVYEDIKLRNIEPTKLTLVDVPAVYATISKEFEVTPASKRRVDVPEKTETVVKSVIVEPATIKWKKVDGEPVEPAEVVDDSTSSSPIVTKYKSVPGSSSSF